MNEHGTFDYGRLKALFAKLVIRAGRQDAAAAYLGISRQRVSQLGSANPEHARDIPTWEQVWTLVSRLTVRTSNMIQPAFADRPSLERYVGERLTEIMEAISSVEQDSGLFPTGLTPSISRALSFARGAAPPLMADPADQTVETCLKALATLRWQKSQSFTYDGVVAAPADSALAAVTGFVVAAQIAPPDGATVWKLGQNAFRLWSFEQVVNYGIAIRTHIQACFDREEALTVQIVPAEDPASIDITTGWPT